MNDITEMIGGMIDFKSLQLVKTSACLGITSYVMFPFAVWAAIYSGQTKSEREVLDTSSKHF